MIDQELIIVLKRLLPYQQKYAVFGKTIGKAVVMIGSPRDARLLWPGATLAVSLEKKRGSTAYFITRHELLGAWHELDPQLLSFYHQFLELTYYLIPSGTVSNRLFQTLYTALSLSIAVMNEENLVWQKSCRVKLLAACGFYPPPPLRPFSDLFDRCAERFVDGYDYESIVSELKSFSCTADEKEAMLSAWVLDCISGHPCFAQFKTVGDGCGF